MSIPTFLASIYSLIADLNSATSVYVAAQALGLFAMALDLWSTTLRNDRRLMLTIALSSGIFSIHFALLDAPAGALSEGITVLRTLTAVYWRNLTIGGVYIVGYIFAAVNLKVDLIDALPFIASIFGTSGMFWAKGYTLRMPL